MLSPNNPQQQLYHGFEPGNGTAPISRSHLDEKSLPSDSLWFVVEHLTTTNFALASSPKRVRAEPRPEVMASLERSLKEHADVWAELAKH